MKLLISPNELAADASCVVFDCRFSLMDKQAGFHEYAAGHIPGARHADLERDLSAAPGKAGRHPLPDRADLATCLRTWGIRNDSRVVCYDQNSSAFAGRFWWLVRWLGHADVSVLDGGLDAWIAGGFETEAESVSPDQGDFTERSPLTRTCSPEDLPDANVNLLDARDAARFRGESEPLDSVAGHIPGALCVPFVNNLAGGQFKSPEVLRKQFRTQAIHPESEIVCYCGSGVTATHNILALLLAGYPEPALYPGSWSEWITDPNRPVETG